ncbi:helix-turn-helix domain-containing protein [Wolbachia endosymbiont (group B) of Xanthorhoe designata]|uniref:WO male-killing family protein Wmk n=1 Tax=Wolbachia endosymbiont (group B) of Xanthorhoe designata TaxID=3066184 RepID=UPI00333EC186
MANISIRYQIAQKVRNWRLKRGYTQKDLAKKIGTTYQVILQYEKGTRRISIKKLYELAEALSTTARDLACGQEVSNEKGYEGEEVLNLVRRHKEIKDQELRETFYLLTKFIRISEEESGKAVKVEVAKGLVKEGVSISQTTSLSIDEYDEKKISIPYKVGQRIKEWRLRRGYTQEDLASKVGIINQRIYEYEQGRAAVSLEMLDEIAKVLLINITGLLPETRENENSEVELSRLIEEYKKIKSQELRNVLIKSLFESIQVCKEKVKRVEKMRIAKNLVKEGISINIILKTVGISLDEIQQI